MIYYILQINSNLTFVIGGSYGLSKEVKELDETERGEGGFGSTGTTVL